MPALWFLNNEVEIPEEISNPGKVDEALWAKAKKQVQKEYGEIRWPVVTAVYKKMGGTFQ